MLLEVHCHLFCSSRRHTFSGTRLHHWYVLITYCTLAIITRGLYYFSIFSRVGFSLMFGGIPMKLGGYKTREVIIRARLMMASVRYIKLYFAIFDSTDSYLVALNCSKINGN